VGGGFGGLESAFYLRIKLQNRAHITLVSDQDHFLFKPNTIYIPFGLPVDKLTISPETRREMGSISLTCVCTNSIWRRCVGFSSDGANLPYDFLVIATGSGMRPQHAQEYG